MEGIQQTEKIPVIRNISNSLLKQNHCQRGEYFSQELHTKIKNSMEENDGTFR